MVSIVDNFLDQDEFDTLQTFILDFRFAWYYNDVIVSFSDGESGKWDSPVRLQSAEEDKNKFQFIHVFFTWDASMAWSSQHFEILKPILEKINPISLCRIKANLLTKTPNIIESGFHVDMTGSPEEKIKQCTISIFYVNTNNGYTKFEDGTKIESVANRIVTFPANMKHTGTSCTDEKRRVVINFNYLKK